MKLSGEPRDRIAACALGDGWLLGFDQWMGGWGYAARMAAMGLDRSGTPLHEIPENREKRLKLPEAPMLDLQKLLASQGGEYQQGKGHAAFWQAAVACHGQQALVVMDYAWRTAETQRVELCGGGLAAGARRRTVPRRPAAGRRLGQQRLEPGGAPPGPGGRAAKAISWCSTKTTPASIGSRSRHAA